MTKARKFLQDRPRLFRVVFLVSWVFSLGLFLGGFFTPPTGQIDGSLLKAAGILLAFSSISMLPDIIASGKSATIEHGDTKVTFGNKENGDN